MRRYRSLTILFTPLLSLFSHAAAAEVSPSSMPQEMARVEFDTQAISAYGLDHSLAAFFAEESKFTPGEHVISLSVNGTSRGLIRAKFDEKGQICASPDIINHARLMVKKTSDENPCAYLTDLLPNANVKYTPRNNEVSFVVSPDVISSAESAKNVAIQGGTAGLLNYSIYGTRNEFDGSANDRINATLEAGFNVDDWIVRSTQIVSDDSEGSFSHDSLYTWAQRTFTDYSVVAQGGEINVNNSPFSIPTLYGMQFFPESGLTSNGSGVEVSGIARSAQARVDVRQNGRLIYTSLVPAGPFTLKNVPIISNNFDLDVSVVETDNSEQHYSVPASTFRGQRVGQGTGLSFAAGRVREADTAFSTPWVTMVSNDWQLAMNKRISAAGMFADNHYYAASVNFDHMPASWFSTRTEVIGAVDNQTQRDGTRQLFDAYWSTPWNLTFNSGLSRRDANYREFMEVYEEDEEYAYEKYETHFGTSWMEETAGTFSLNWYRSRYWNDNEAAERLALMWAKTFKYASINVSWQTGISNSDDEGNEDEDMFYAGISIPLGGGAYSNSWYREYGERASYGTRLSSPLTENSNIAVGMQRDKDSDVNNWDTSVNGNLHYTTMGVAASGDNNSNRSYSSTMDGGIVAHRNGATFSPYKVNETFGVVSLDRPLAGVEIDTSRGRVWTDYRGQAVIASIPPYQNSALGLNTQSLPGNVDVVNGKTLLNTSHGAVANWQFETLSQRRVMFTLIRPNGKPLPKGVSIVNAKGEYISSSPEDGMVFINNVTAEDRFYARLSEKERCELIYKLPEQAPDAFYEEIKGTCRDVIGTIQ